MKKITSKDNPAVKLVQKLKKKKERDKSKLYLVEGKKEIELASQLGHRIKVLNFCPAYKTPELSMDLSNVSEVNHLEQNLFASISYRENPDGYLAVLEQKLAALSDLKLSNQAFLLILQNIEKPGNLGAIMRTADAAGADAIILNDQSTDIFNPNVIRASLGAFFSVPLILADKSETYDFLANNKIRSVATTPNADQVYTKIDLKGAVAVLVGEEHAGLDDFWLQKADYRVNIPMRGRLDSLNASVSAAVLAFEVLRQREFVD